MSLGGLADAPAHASEAVTLTNGRAEVLAHGETNEGRSTDGLVFNESLTVSGAAASHDSTITDGAAAISFRALTSAVTTLSGASGGSSLARNFTVLTAVPYRFTVKVTGGTSGRFSFALFHSGVGHTFAADNRNFAGSDTFARSGTLTPGNYQFHASGGCSTLSDACAAGYDMEFDIGSVGNQPVTITSGPRGTVTEASATFEFATTSDPPPAGRFECSLDGGAFEGCGSPKGYSNLADGEHGFRVRYKPDGQIGGTPVERRWTVDASAPTVSFDEAPSGAANPADARFVFHSSKPVGATFRCSLDAGAEFDCSSPHSLTGLAAGPHIFAVRAFDAGGHAGPVAIAGWTVVVTCPDVRVGLVVVKGCFTERQSDGKGTGIFESAGEAWIGGLHVVPRPDGKLVVRNSQDTPLAAEGAGVQWVLGSLAVDAPLAELRPFQPDFAVGLNLAGSFQRFLALPFLQGLSAQTKVTWDPGGRGSKLEASVSMEELTKNLGKPLAGIDGKSVSVGTLAAKLGATFVNGKPADLADGELEVPEFAVELKGTNPVIKKGFGGGKFKAAKVGATVEWSGEVTVLFPWKGDEGTNQGAVKARLSFLDTQITGLGFSLSGFEQAIGRTGWDMTGIEGDVVLTPAFSFNVGVQAQQRTSFAGVSVLKAAGNLKALKLAEADCAAGNNPVAFVGTFNAPPLEQQKIGELKGQLLMCAYVGGKRNFAFEAGISGALTIDVGKFTKLLSATGSAKGWFSGTDFNLDGSYGLTAPLIGKIAATGVISSEGYAVCGQYGFINAGFATDNWLEPPTDLTACDFTPFRVATKPSAATRLAAAATAAQGGRTVRLPAGQSAFGFAVRGTTGAPAIRVTGPAGEQFTSRAGEATKGARAIILPIDELKTTYVYLRAPRPGTWHVEPQEGPAIERIDTARELPAANVRARVIRKGSRFQVTWRTNKVPGQTIELVDRTDGGTATTIQAPTRKTRGVVRFTPADPLVTRRRIEAVIVRGGSPRPPVIAARYRIAAPRPPGRVTNPAAKRAGAGLGITWRKAPRASTYVVTIKLGAAVLTRAVSTRPRLTYTDAPSGKLTIEISPRDRFGRTGRATTFTAG